MQAVSRGAQVRALLSALSSRVNAWGEWNSPVATLEEFEAADGTEWYPFAPLTGLGSLVRTGVNRCALLCLP